MAVEEVKPENKVENEPVDALLPPEEEVEVDPLVEPEGAPEPDNKVHPLKPGGSRFEQVYAKGKQAERDRDHERELRIAAEAKLEALSAPKTETPEAEIEYNWTQLEEFITQGRITRAEAEAHRESVNNKKLSKQIKADFQKESQTTTRYNVLTNSIAEYLTAVPAITTAGSDDQQRLDEEFNFIASIQGVDTSKLDDVSRKALQLTALRNVYGSIDSLTKRTSATPKTETHQGLPGGIRPKPSTNPDQALVDGLTKAQVAHYQKMFRVGRYPKGWADVVEELKFVPKTVSR